MNVAEDPYKLLGVPRDATPEAIKAAYRKLARKHHPDLNPGKPEAEDRFKAVSAANDLLSDPERRARFDRAEINAEGQESASPGASYRHYAEQQAGERYGQRPNAETFEDLFADIFEARRRAEATPRRGADELYRLRVPFLDAVEGATEQLNLPGGRVLSVKIPPGIVTGQVLRLRGQGGPGLRGGPAGDALIEVDVAEDKRWRREGLDLHMDLPVSLQEAVLGGACWCRHRRVGCASRFPRAATPGGGSGCAARGWPRMARGRRAISSSRCASSLDRAMQRLMNS